MAMLLCKMIKDRQDLWMFAGVLIIAAGWWCLVPHRDVTTIMLWIGGQITAGNIITEIFLPSLFVC
jgi:hypothetical protein